MRRYSAASRGTTEETIAESKRENSIERRSQRPEIASASSSAVADASVATRQLSVSSEPSKQPMWVCVFPMSTASSISAEG